MAIRVRRPTSEDLAALRRRCADEPLTYSPVGISDGVAVPPGFRFAHYERELGLGGRVFESAQHAIRDWQVHRGSGLLVSASGPPAVDDVVAVAAPLPLGFMEIVCRVVRVVDEPHRFGFAYGTLPIHAARGEEAFTVTRGTDGRVRFEIDVASRPQHPLARLAPPITRLMQRQATDRYLDAMTAATR